MWLTIRIPSNIRPCFCHSFRSRDHRDEQGSPLYLYYEFNFLKKQRTDVHFMASLFPELDLRCSVRFMYEATRLSDFLIYRL
jgi:hypothetical protein